MTKNNTNTSRSDAPRAEDSPSTPRIPRRARSEKTQDRRDAGQPRHASHLPSETGIVPAANPETNAVTPASEPEVQHGTGETGAEHNPVLATILGLGGSDGFNGCDLVIPGMPEPEAPEVPSAGSADHDTSEAPPADPSDREVSDMFMGENPSISPEAIERANQREARLSPEMKNAFLRFRNSARAARSSRSALAMSKLMRIRLPYPRQIEGMGELEELRLLGLEMQGEQQLALTIFERTGCGKSTLAQQYKLMRNMEKANSVIHARMGTSGTARDLWVSVMSELGDGFASAGNEHSLRRRAMKALEDAGVELLILDETQHSGQKTGFSREVTAELKIMLDTGKVPIVLMGTEKAVPMIQTDRELAGRMFSPCRLAPLEMTDDEDFDLWCDMLQDLDARMVAENLLTQPFGFDREEIAEALGEITEGIIGQLMRVMLMAVRNMVHDERTVMTMQDLIFAVDEWSNELGFAKSNPLRSL